MKTDNSDRKRNLMIIVLIFLTTLFAAFHEGYFSMIAPVFWIGLGTGFLIAVWLALKVSAARLLALILVVFCIEYIKESIGVRTGLWVYHGMGGFYIFGVWAWVLAALIAYALAAKVLIKWIRKAKFSLSVWVNPVLLILIASIIPLTLGKYHHRVDAIFWVFYLLLLIVGLAASVRMKFPVLAGIVLAAWLVSNPSEYLGSVASRVWTFPYNAHYPPFYLLFGCWPLEMLAQFTLASMLADEPVDQDTF